MTTFRQIKQSLAKALGDDVRFVKGASTRGKSWELHSKGLAGHIFHHTANPHATGHKGAPSLRWCINANGEMPFCNAVVGRGGTYYVLSLGSCWHSGYGGPWPSRGFSRPADNYSARAFWGVEIDDPGRGRTITSAQIKSASVAAAALADLCEWDPYALVTHGDWTDAGPYLMDKHGKQESGYGPYRGRKADTIRSEYSGEFWRKEVSKYRTTKLDFGPLAAAIRTSNGHESIMVVSAALEKTGLGGFTANNRWSRAKASAYRHWQLSNGFSKANGIPTKDDLALLGRKTGMFRVV